MPISEILTLPYVYKRPLPRFQNGDDIKFPDSLVAAMLEKFTKLGDKILDPFTGLGTTFFVCEEMGRVPYGVEADKRRHDWVKDRVQSKENLFLGDSADIPSLGLPKMDFSIASPPYMPRRHKWNPLYNGNPKYAGYDNYIKRMQKIYAGVQKIMKRNAYVVVQADNLAGEYFSPLVWDLGAALSKIMRLEGEMLIQWSENRENENAFTQCLIFKNSGGL